MSEPFPPGGALTPLNFKAGSGAAWEERKSGSLLQSAACLRLHGGGALSEKHLKAKGLSIRKVANEMLDTGPGIEPLYPSIQASEKVTPVKSIPTACSDTSSGTDAESETDSDTDTVADKDTDESAEEKSGMVGQEDTEVSNSHCSDDSDIESGSDVEVAAGPPDETRTGEQKCPAGAMCYSGEHCAFQLVLSAETVWSSLIFTSKVAW